MSITGGGAFLQTLVAAGIKHVFVNWGNDHPSLLEALEKERLANGGKNALEIVTAPNEMVALSAAQGYAQISGNPAAVIVHVDVGTQGLGAAIHNADKGRVPVLIFSGASPHSGQGELKGSKNEWPMWGQEIPDQAAIVRQYMRYTTQLMSAKTLAKVTLRALQFATTQPKGPVYLYAHREILEEELDTSLLDFTRPNLNPTKWPAVQGGGLSPDVVRVICGALLTAKFPLLITGGTDRNPRTGPLVRTLSETFAIAVFTSCPAQTCASYSHPAFLGSSYGGKNPLLEEADVLLIVEADLPWVDVNGNASKTNAKVFVIDSDPLKVGMGWAHTDADIICRADVETALTMLLHAADEQHLRDRVVGYKERWTELHRRHDAWIRQLQASETTFQGDPAVKSTAATAPNALHILRCAVRLVVSQHAAAEGRDPRATIWLNETASNQSLVFNHVRMTDEDVAQGSMVMASGGSGLGWILGASIGVALGASAASNKPELIVAIVGDGSFIFSVPSAAYWMARRYDTPFLTIVVNNGGWASPKASMMGVYPSGDGAKASGSRLTVGLGPDMVDFGGIAAAAGGAWSGRAELWNMKEVFEQATKVVLEEKRCAVVECVIESF